MAIRNAVFSTISLEVIRLMKYEHMPVGNTNLNQKFLCEHSSDDTSLNTSVSDDRI